MKVLAWNCRGICNNTTVQALRKLIQKHHPSFIFLSETKVSDKEYMANLRLQIGYLNCEAVFSSGQSGGLALFWEDGLDVRFRSKSAYHVDVEVHPSNGSMLNWRLTGFCGHPTTALRHITWSLLRELGEETSLPWVILGDFNELLHAGEKSGGVPRRESQMQLFRDALLSHSDLFDLGFRGSPFTWEGGGVRCRLDRAFASASWSDVFPASRVLNLEPIHGDHVPILVEVSCAMQTAVRRRPRFKFESFWVSHEACEGIVDNGWSFSSDGRPMLQVVQKIRSTRLSLNNWQRMTFGNRDREINLLRSRLQELLTLPLTLVSQQESVELSNRLEVLLDADHKYWQQRAKVLWLSEGDRNTKYFHRKASNRRAKNKLLGLFDADGVWQTSEQGIETVVVDYFSSMFTAGDMDHVHMMAVVDSIQPKVTSQMNLRGVRVLEWSVSKNGNGNGRNG